jgi:hypothetical protein
VLVTIREINMAVEAVLTILAAKAATKAVSNFGVLANCPKVWTISTGVSWLTVSGAF